MRHKIIVAVIPCQGIGGANSCTLTVLFLLVNSIVKIAEFYLPALVYSLRNHVDVDVYHLVAGFYTVGNIHTAVYLLPPEPACQSFQLFEKRA